MQFSSFHVSSRPGFVEIRNFLTWVHHIYFNCFVGISIVSSNVRKHFWVTFCEIMAIFPFHVSSRPGFVEIRNFLTWAHHTYFSCFVVTRIVSSNERKHFWVQFCEKMAISREFTSRFCRNQEFFNLGTSHLFQLLCCDQNSKQQCEKAFLGAILRNNGYNQPLPCDFREGVSPTTLAVL